MPVQQQQPRHYSRGYRASCFQKKVLVQEARPRPNTRVLKTGDNLFFSPFFLVKKLGYESITRFFFW